MTSKGRYDSTNGVKSRISRKNKTRYFSSPKGLRAIGFKDRLFNLTYNEISASSLIILSTLTGSRTILVWQASLMDLGKFIESLNLDSFLFAMLRFSSPANTIILHVVHLPLPPQAWKCGIPAHKDASRIV